MDAKVTNENSNLLQHPNGLLRLLAISCQRMFQVWHHPDLIFYNTQLGREFQSILKKFKDYTGQVIAEKRNSYQKQKEYAKLCPEAQTAETTKMKSFIQILLELTEDEGIFSTDELRDEINTFLVAVICFFKYKFTLINPLCNGKCCFLGSRYNSINYRNCFSNDGNVSTVSSDYIKHKALPCFLNFTFFFKM